MRSRKGGCLGNHDMGVNIDRGGRGPARGAIGIMEYGRRYGRSDFLLSIMKVNLLLTREVSNLCF